MRHYDVTSHTLRHYLKRRHYPCDIRALRHKPGGHEVLLNRKLHIDRREAEVNMNCLLFNNTSYSSKQKSAIVLLYKKVERSVIKET